MKREDLLLLVVAAGEDKPLTPVQLQKSLFLLGQEWRTDWPLSPENFYDFEPYHYGPFDAEIYDDADSLEGQGLVRSAQSDRGNWRDRVITISGAKRADELNETLPQAIAVWIQEVVRWVQAMSFAGLVRAIYDRYPDFRENSIFQG